MNHRLIRTTSPTNSYDQDYEDATDNGHIRTADHIDIARFTTEWLTRCNYHSLIGSVRLASKYAVQSVTAVLYP